jgi:DNA polymerase I-like protein with 3'-5' exonuclease and polymerase domains
MVVTNYQKDRSLISPTTNTVFLDIEADGLNPTKVHCVVTKRSNEAHLTHLSRRSLMDELARGGQVCGHNVIGYDLPVLHRLWGIRVPQDRVVDTLVLSRLFHPDLDGGHSLAAWGGRLGFPKGDHSDWSELSEEMVEYCKRDVDVTERLHDALVQQLRLFGFTKHCVDLEHSVAFICKDQEDNGFEFDKDGAVELYEELTSRMHRIERDLQQVFPPIVEERISDKTQKRLKDKVTVFNVGSRQQIAERLASKGAVWEELTPAGKPKVDEKTLKKQTHIPEAKIILRYLLCQKRASQVDSWIKAVEEDKRIHGRVRHIGAVTGRMAHSNPNMAQVPAVRAEYGKQCRSLFTAPAGHVLVGADASGLELRMLAHYMNDEKYTNEILTGDIHTANRIAAGLDNRDDAKTFIYAFLYGAGDAKIGSIVGGTAAHGKKLKQAFLENTPALADLRNETMADAETGFLTGLDGRRIRVRSAHAALNTLLQGAGAVVMKQAIVILYDLLERVNFKLVAQVHDEWQIECKPEDADFIGKSCVNAMVFAGEVLQLNCPLDGEYRIGNSWADTH